MHARRLTIAPLVIATGLFVGCSSDGGESISTIEPSPSWACIQVIGLSQLTTGSTIGFARSTLKALVNDTTRDADERGYVADMLGALENKPDDDLIGDALDDVPCRLK